MSPHAPNKRIDYIVLGVTVLTLVGGVLASTTWARVVFNTIDPVGDVRDHGRRIVVTGPISCDEGQRSDLRVTVTQRSTGAVAEGRTVITCTGAVQQWEVHASVHGRESLEEGPAIAVALASTSTHGDTDDAHQWLVGITLVKEYGPD